MNQEFPPAHELLPVWLANSLKDVGELRKNLAKAGEYMNKVGSFCTLLAFLVNVGIPDEHLEGVIHKLKKIRLDATAEGLHDIADTLWKAIESLGNRKMVAF